MFWYVPARTIWLNHFTMSWSAIFWINPAKIVLIWDLLAFENKNLMDIYPEYQFTCFECYIFSKVFSFFQKAGALPEAMRISIDSTLWVQRSNSRSNQYISMPGSLNLDCIRPHISMLATTWNTGLNETQDLCTWNCREFLMNNMAAARY
mgnify:FL=1